MIEIQSIRDLLALEERLRRLWGPRNELIEEMRRLRFMEVQPEVPAEIEPEKVITPYGYQFVRQAVGLLTADPVQITVPPPGEGDRAVETASRMEVFLSALLDQLCKQADDDVVERFIECLIADGHGCIRCLWAPQLWRGYPRRRPDQPEEEYNREAEEWKRSRPIPISLAWVDPLNVFPLWSEAGLEAVLEVDKRDVASLDPSKYNRVSRRGRVLPELWEAARVKGQGGPLTFRQLWTRERVVYAVEDVIVHDEAHGLGQPPYIYAMGDTVSTRDPGKMGLSMLFALRYLQPYFDRLLSQRGTAIRFVTWPTLVYEQQPLALPSGSEGSDVEAANELEIRPGKVIPLQQGERLYFLGWQGTGPDIDEQIAMVKAMMDLATLPGVMYGQPGTADTGYAINQLITAARVQFKPTTAHASRALEQLMALILEIIESKARQKLYVYVAPKGKGKPRKGSSGWIGLGPEDIRGWRMVNVTVNRVMPTDAYAVSSRMINEVNAGMRSVLSAMEQIGIEQPDVEMRRILVEAWKRSPQVQAWLTEQALRRAGVRLQEQKTTPAQLADLLPQMPPALQQAIVAWLQGQGGQGGGAGSPPQAGMGQPGPNVAGMPPAAVMAAPGVQAAPGPPPARPLAGALGGAAPQAGGSTGHVGPVTKPSGVATGRAPGVKRKAQG